MHSVWRGIAEPVHEARVAVAAHLLALGLLLLLCGLRAPGHLVGAASWTIAEPSTGDFVWQVAAPDSIIPALAYANGLVVDGAGATLEVRRAASGARLYSYTTRGPIYGAPSVANGRIYAGSADGKVYAFGVARHR